MAAYRDLVFFTVEGGGEFPMDMLRFDECWPEGPSDAAKMGATYADPATDTGRRSIRLGSFRHGIAGPTEKRWESFGWRVTDIGEPARFWDSSLRRSG